MLRGILFISLLLQTAGWIGVSGFVYRWATPETRRGDVRDLRTMTGFEQGSRSGAVTGTQLGGHSVASHSLVRPVKRTSRSTDQDVFGGRSKEDPPVVQNSNLPYMKPEEEGVQLGERMPRVPPRQRVKRDLERQVQPRSSVDDLVQSRPFNRDDHESPSPVQARQTVRSQWADGNSTFIKTTVLLISGCICIFAATFLGTSCCKNSSKENPTVVEVKAGPSPETRREIFAENRGCTYASYPELEAPVHESSSEQKRATFAESRGCTYVNIGELGDPQMEATTPESRSLSTPSSEHLVQEDIYDVPQYSVDELRSFENATKQQNELDTIDDCAPQKQPTSPPIQQENELEAKEDCAHLLQPAKSPMPTRSSMRVHFADEPTIKYKSVDSEEIFDQRHGDSVTAGKRTAFANGNWKRCDGAVDETDVMSTQSTEVPDVLSCPEQLNAVSGQQSELEAMEDCDQQIQPAKPPMLRQATYTIGKVSDGNLLGIDDVQTHVDQSPSPEAIPDSVENPDLRNSVPLVRSKDVFLYLPLPNRSSKHIVRKSMYDAEDTTDEPQNFKENDAEPPISPTLPKKTSFEGDVKDTARDSDIDNDK